MNNYTVGFNQYYGIFIRSADGKIVAKYIETEEIATTMCKALNA